MAGEYLKSSVHVHSKLCDGKNTLDEIAVTAWRTGLQTLGFSGHSHTPPRPRILYDPEPHRFV